MRVAPERVIVTAGSSAALLLVMALIVNRDDRILLADPGYPCNRHFVRVLEGDPYGVPVDAATNYQLTAELIDRHWTAQTRGALIASPSNPTGTVVPHDEMRRIAQTVADRGGHLVVDEIYLGLTYGERPRSVLEFADDAFVVSSFSKYFNMTGWRLGWVVAPERYVRDLEKLAQNLYISPATPSQRAALACFTPETLAILETRRRAFEARRDRLVPALRELGFRIPVLPTGWLLRLRRHVGTGARQRGVLPRRARRRGRGDHARHRLRPPSQRGSRALRLHDRRGEDRRRHRAARALSAALACSGSGLAVAAALRVGTSPPRSGPATAVSAARLRRPLACIAACLVAGCGAMEAADYYWQGASGQLDILARAKPIPDVIAESGDAALAQRLRRVQQIRAYASAELALPDNRSYTSYADLGRPFVVWNVFATPELSLKPRQWCFPVAGCVSYRGYFNEAEAREEAARLHAAGEDVVVSGVPAYSTLGYFDDPVLSTFVRWPEVEVARMLFHELSHQVVYVKDDTQFNESFAAAVEEVGVERWLRAQGNPQLQAQYARSQQLRAAFRTLVRDTRIQLAALYATDLPDADKRRQKAAAFVAMREGYERAQGRRAGPGRLRPLVQRLRQRRSQQRERGVGGTVLGRRCRRFGRCWRKRAATCRGSMRG